MRARAGLALLLAGLCACAEDEAPSARLDGPMDLALLEPGPFYEVPVALVTNFRSGRVSKLDVKRTNLLVEAGPAPWMPGPDLAFGAGRALSEIAIVERGSGVDVWVADDASDSLLRRTWIAGIGEDGAPLWPEPALGETRLLSPDGVPLQGEVTPRLLGLRLGHGRATTETWTLRWEGRAFAVEGSASGIQDRKAVPGTPYESDRGEIRFTLALDGVILETGSRIEVDVDGGVEEADAGGLVMDLWREPGGAWVLAAVLPDEGPGWVAAWDAESMSELARVTLPQGAQPERIEADVADGSAWVADSWEGPEGAGRVFRLDWIPGDAQSLAATVVPVPEPAIDVAPGHDPAAPRLFVAAAYTDAVWMLDRASGAVLDANVASPEADPTRVRALVTGLAPLRRPVETMQLDEDGTRVPAYGVLAATFAGEMYWIDGRTGCQVFGTPAGASLQLATADPAAAAFSDVGFASNPVLVQDPASERVVSTSTCGGVARTETWNVTFDAGLQSYEVEGSRSGVQAGRAYEGERYVSDEGAISFLILPGTAATSHGDRWQFPIDDGVTPMPLHELPADPLVFTELYDDRSGIWFAVREREVALVPNAGNDVVLWIDVQGQGQQGVRAWN